MIARRGASARRFGQDPDAGSFFYIEGQGDFIRAGGFYIEGQKKFMAKGGKILYERGDFISNGRKSGGIAPSACGF